MASCRSTTTAWWVWSDLHLGDVDALDFFGRPFGSVDEMDDVILEHRQAQVGPDDLVVCLGDIARANLTASLGRLRGLSGRSRLAGALVGVVEVHRGGTPGCPRGSSLSPPLAAATERVEKPPAVRLNLRLPGRVEPHDEDVAGETKWRGIRRDAVGAAPQEPRRGRSPPGPGKGSRRLRERVGGRMAARTAGSRTGGAAVEAGDRGQRPEALPARASRRRSTPAESPPRLRLWRQMGGAAANFREDVSGRGVRRWGRTARPPGHRARDLVW